MLIVVLNLIASGVIQCCCVAWNASYALISSALGRVSETLYGSDETDHLV